MRSQRPTATDAPEAYLPYIDRIEGDDIIEQLAKQMVETRARLSSVDDERAGFRYQPGKWSVKQVIGHLADCERVFAYRALAFSRGDQQAIPGMDQDAWMNAARFDEQTFPAVLADLVTVREGTLTLFQGLSDEQWRRRGTACDADFQVGAIAWVIAAHELHHRGVLEERYGIGA